MTATTSHDDNDEQQSAAPPSAEGSPGNRSEGSSPGMMTRSMANSTPAASTTTSGRPGRPAGPRRTSTADTATMTGAATVPPASSSTLPSAENSPREGGAGGAGPGGNSRTNSNNGRNVRTSPNNASHLATGATVPGGQRVPSIARRSVSSGSGDGGGFGSGGGGAAPSASSGPRRSARHQNQPGSGGPGHMNSNASGTGSGGSQEPPRMAPTGVNVVPGRLASSTTGAGVGPGGAATAAASASGARCINPANEINSRLDAHVEVKVYPCNNNASSSQQNKKNKFTQFTIKPEGVIIQGANSRHRTAQSGSGDLGAEYAKHIGRKLRRYELSDTRACQLLVTTHGGSYWAVPAPEAFSRHSGTCRLLGDRKHPLASHTLQVGDFLRVGSVGVVVIETHDGTENKILSEDKIKKIIKDTTSGNGGFLDFGETEDENSDDSDMDGPPGARAGAGGQGGGGMLNDSPTCYMCFDDEDTEENPLITPCKCRGDTRYVHVSCLRKWHTAEADNQICFLSSVDATCSVCKTTFKSDFRLKDGRTMKLFKSSLEPPYVSLLVATKHEMAQRLFNTRFQLSFSTLMKPDGKNGTRPLLLGRSSGSDMVLDYRTVSARHASIKFKNGEFIFTDAGSSNGSYLYLRRPVELTPQQPVQFRLGRSMISMKVNSKWNERLLRTIRNRGGSSSNDASGEGDDHSVGSNEDDVRVISDEDGTISRTVPKRTRESIIESMPPPGKLLQSSPKHLDLLYALAYPRRQEKNAQSFKKQGSNVAAKNTNHQAFLSSLTGGGATPAAPVALPAVAASSSGAEAEAGDAVDMSLEQQQEEEGEDSKVEESSDGAGAAADDEDSDDLNDEIKDSEDVMVLDDIAENMDVEGGNNNVAADEEEVGEVLV